MRLSDSKLVDADIDSIVDNSLSEGNNKKKITGNIDNNSIDIMGNKFKTNDVLLGGAALILTGILGVTALKTFMPDKFDELLGKKKEEPVKKQVDNEPMSPPYQKTTIPSTVTEQQIKNIIDTGTPEPINFNVNDIDFKSYNNNDKILASIPSLKKDKKELEEEEEEADRYLRGELF